MNIPEKGYDPLPYGDWSKIEIYTSTNANNIKSKTVKLPAWLRSLILTVIARSKADARREALKPIKDALGI